MGCVFLSPFNAHLLMLVGMEQKMRVGDFAFLLAMAFLFGVFAVDKKWNTPLVLLLSFSVVAILLVVPKINISWKYGAYFLFACILGIVYCSAYIGLISLRTHLPSGKSAAFLGTVADEPKRAGNFLMLDIDLYHPYYGTVDVFTSPSRQVNYGDLLWIRGTIYASKDPDEAPVIFLPELNLVIPNNGFWLKDWAITVKSFIGRQFERYFSSDKAALLSGIVLGTTSMLSATLKQQMDASGTSYIVGMYGYKIAVICVAIAAALKGALPRKTLLFFTLAAVWLFIFVSGESVSAIRAGIMGSIALIAVGIGKTFAARNALVFTALMFTLIDPRALVEAAFQLSFLSFLGIYYLGNPIKNFFHWTDDGWVQWKEHAMLALTTNLAILPVVINVFGSFSLSSFISNVLIMIPWVVVIFLGIVITTLGPFSGVLAFVPIQLTNILLSYELFVIRVSAKLVIPIPNIFISSIAVIFYYGILLLFIYYYGEAA
jgi:ComEC/Rec2-related protein